MPAAVCLATPLDPYLALNFVPQEDVEEVMPELPGAMTETPFELRVVDGRRSTEATWVGTRTDDDDRPHPLHASNDIVAFVEGGLTEVARAWGLRVEPGAGRVLEVTLQVLQVEETNKAMGASFAADGRFAVALLGGSGDRLWSGVAAGEASRYGRAGSDANCNEALSDALLAAFADALGQPGLHQAWNRPVPTRALPRETTDDALAFHIAVVTPGSTAANEEVVEPEALLDDLLELLEQGFETETLLDFLDHKALSAPLSVDDLASWKEAGVPEEVIRAALDLPVR